MIFYEDHMFIFCSFKITHQPMRPKNAAPDQVEMPMLPWLEVTARRWRTGGTPLEVDWTAGGCWWFGWWPL